MSNCANDINCANDSQPKVWQMSHQNLVPLTPFPSTTFVGLQQLGLLCVQENESHNVAFWTCESAGRARTYTAWSLAHPRKEVDTQLGLLHTKDQQKQHMYIQDTDSRKHKIARKVHPHRRIGKHLAVNCAIYLYTLELLKTLAVVCRIWHKWKRPTVVRQTLWKKWKRLTVVRQTQWNKWMRLTVIRQTLWNKWEPFAVVCKNW